MSVQKIRLSVAFVVLIVGTCSVFGRDIPIGWFNASAFKVEEPITLCFDLNVANPPGAAVVIKLPPQPAIVQRSVILPFSVTKVEESKDAYVTWGSFDSLTLVNFINASNVPTSVAVTLVPKPDDAVEGDFFKTDLPGVLYYIESGLKRRFVYRLDATSAVSQDSTLNKLPAEATNTVAVRLPVGAEIFESREGAATAARNLNLISGAVRHYNVLSPLPTASKSVDIVYQLQPTKLQNVLFEYGLKLFGAFIIPLLGVVLLTSDQVKRHRRLRRRILWIGAFVEVALLSTLLWWAFKIQSVTGLSAILEIAVAILGAIATAALGLVKDRVTA